METDMENYALFYGNLSYSHSEQAKTLIPQFSTIIKKFTSENDMFPDYDQSLTEVGLLKRNLTPEILLEDNHRHLAQDEDLFSYLREATDQLGFNKEVFDKIEPVLVKVINPLALQLKAYWNRARPYQYAYEGDIDFHPLSTVSGNTPSYPSGHTMQTETWGLIMKSNYPDLTETIDIIVADINQSRLNMGIHFPSDIKFSKNIIDFLWSHNLINKQ